MRDPSQRNLQSSIYCFRFLKGCHFYTHQKSLGKEFCFNWTCVPHLTSSSCETVEESLQSCRFTKTPLGTAWKINAYLKVTFFSQSTFLSQRVFRTMLGVGSLKYLYVSSESDLTIKSVADRKRTELRLKRLWRNITATEIWYKRVQTDFNPTMFC